VTSGSITLDRASTKVHVGLPYSSDIETLSIETQLQDGVSYGRLMKVASVKISFLNSRGGFIGGNENNLEELVQTSGEDIGSPLALFTGDHDQAINSAFEENGRFFFRQSDPLPFTILSIVPKIYIGG
jgi:hypothetical protein